MYDIVIIGAGPAGLTAAIYARRAEKSVLVLEALSYGGQIIYTPVIENYPAAADISGFDFANNIYNQAVNLGAEIKFEKAIRIENSDSQKTVFTQNGSYICKAVIIATGSLNRKLGLENEDSLAGRGISYCATCDGAFFKNKPVAVVGGGNTALEDALYLADIAQTVYLIHRRDTFRGEEATVTKLKQRDNVEFILNSTVTKLIAEKNLTGIEVSNKDGSTQTIEVNGLFTAIGRIPENQDFADVVNLDKDGYIIADETCKTNAEGIFTAGDNRTKTVRQLVTAAADGAIAATEAIKYIS